MKIFLVYLAFNTYPSYYYGLGYIAAVLKAKGHVVDYIILKDKDDIPEFYKKIKEEKPGLIGFSLTTCQFVWIKEIIETIKSINNVFIVCGGIHPTLKPECIWEISGLDAIVRGEGELPMCELADALQNNRDYLQIRNTWFKKNGTVVKNELRPLIENLDALPFPDKDSCDYQRLLRIQNGLNRYIFSRGCTFDCPYCSNRALLDLYHGKGIYFRVRSPQRAIEEIDRDARRNKFNKIFFDDDIITLNKEWFYNFFRLYKKNFRYPFYCNVRPGFLDLDMVRLLKEAGAAGAVIGIEHGNETFRQTVLKRNITNQQIIDTFQVLEQFGIQDNYAQIMVGLPYENEKLFLDTVRFCRKLHIRMGHYFIYIFQPYPGTEFGRLCEKNLWLSEKDYFFERREAVIDYPSFSKKNIQLCFDFFSFLVRFKYIPLNIFFVRITTFLKIYRWLEVKINR